MIRDMGKSQPREAMGRPLDMHVLASSGHPVLASNLLLFAGDGLSNMTPLPLVSCEHKLIQLRVITVLGAIHSCLL